MVRKVLKTYKLVLTQAIATYADEEDYTIALDLLIAELEAAGSDEEEIWWSIQVLLTYYESTGEGGMLSKDDSNGGAPVIMDARYAHLCVETAEGLMTQLDQLLHPVSDEESPAVEPVSFSLLPNFPNPFNPVTTVCFILPEAGIVQARIYNMLGERVAEPLNSQQTAGYHEFQFDGTDLASGLNFLNLEWKGVIRNQKMLLVK